MRFGWTAILALATTLLTGCSDEAKPADAPSPAATASAAQAAAAASALAGLATSPESLPAAQSKVTPAQAKEALPPGTRVEPEANSWSPDGTGKGGIIRVTVTMPNGFRSTYVAVMVLEGGKWKVLATLPDDSPSPGPTS